MYLIVAATENEIKPLVPFIKKADQVDILVTGMGMVAAAVKLASYLAATSHELSGVLNIGVGGSYPDSGLNTLDLCLAGQEILGDLGVCMEQEILDFDPVNLPVTKHISMESSLLSKVERILKSDTISYTIGNFVTMNCCSGTEERGAYLTSKYQAICENMEGAAIAFTCQEFRVPCVEIRCISNMVEDRNLDNWQLVDAINKVCTATGILLEKLAHQKSSD